MKTTQHFKQTIEAYLIERATYDTLFEESYSNPNKNIDDCITYILNCVKKSGCVGFADDEIYSMAMHYYDEEDIVVGSPINCKVVVNSTIELTQEEKEQAKTKAIERVQSEIYQKLTQPKRKHTTSAQATIQPNLFDL